MFKKMVLCLIFAALIVPMSVFASTECQTKYPVVLVHGGGLSSQVFGINYWYKIPTALHEKGSDVYIASLPAIGTEAERRAELKKCILQVRSISGKNKVNIIGHCLGGLDARYVISNMGMADSVASLTTISSTHKGSALADMMVGLLPGWAEDAVAGALNAFASFFFGDNNPDALSLTYMLTTKYMNTAFNPAVPNIAGVYYQSWAGVKTGITTDLMFDSMWLLAAALEGKNDGCVSVNSAKWGNYRGEMKGFSLFGGVSHVYEINHPLGNTPGWSAVNFYLDVVKDLKTRGF